LVSSFTTTDSELRDFFRTALDVVEPMFYVLFNPVTGLDCRRKTRETRARKILGRR
jgi:hypothetical protein